MLTPPEKQTTELEDADAADQRKQLSLFSCNEWSRPHAAGPSQGNASNSREATSPNASSGLRVVFEMEPR